MVIDTNAFIEPDAMMIESVDAFVANATVARVFVPKDAATWAEVNWLKVFTKNKKRYLVTLLYRSWVLNCSCRKTTSHH